LAAAELAAGKLAAGKLAAAELGGLLARLEADYDFLHDPANPVARHQTLRAAIGWSHELCTPAERLLWARLSVFAGPFRLEDAQDVCATGRLPDDAVAAGLTLLTERSVLLADDGPGRVPSFRLPGTLRAYGRGMLQRVAEDAEFQGRYERWRDKAGAP
jgi:predicted ATPase